MCQQLAYIAGIQSSYLKSCHLPPNAMTVTHNRDEILSRANRFEFQD
jgi:hypothetical protein